MLNMTTRRKLSAEERADAARLKAIWDLKKRPLSLTQEKVSELMGWSTQSSFSQYLNGRIALNLAAVVGLAKILEVSPEQISPRLAKILPFRGGDGIAETTASYALTPSQQALDELQGLVELKQLTDDDLKALIDIARRMKREQ